MDLSKILDTIACDLLIAKRHAYYFSNDIIKLLYSYSNNTWHRAN